MTTTTYTLSLHDALPILLVAGQVEAACRGRAGRRVADGGRRAEPGIGGMEVAELRIRDRADRKSTRLNSNHVAISYAVFCLKKKKPYSRYRKQVKEMERE